MKLSAYLLATPLLSALCAAAAEGFMAESGMDLLSPPPIGAHQLRILSAAVLELSLVTTKEKSSQRAGPWDFVADGTRLKLPGVGEFVVTANEQVIPVQEIGFRRRVIYAPLQRRDLRIGNYLYLRLAKSIEEAQSVQVKNPGGALWGESSTFSAVADPFRYSPVIHVNQVGYVPEFPKTAMVGYFLGSAGELDVPATAGFELTDAQSCKVVYKGHLVPRRDVGFPGVPQPYQRVLEADFTQFKTPGEYRLCVHGLGTSFPFFITDGAAAAITRTYALGLYHQRCGTSNSVPFTRFVHAACHVAPAARSHFQLYRGPKVPC